MRRTRVKPVECAAIRVSAVTRDGLRAIMERKGEQGERVTIGSIVDRLVKEYGDLA